MFGYFRRLQGSLAAMVFGIVLIPAAVALHAWNEYRTVHRSRGLAEARSLVSSLESITEVDRQRDHQLIHIVGRADTEQILADDQFKISQRAIHLRRRVEMYQWVEQQRRSRGNSDAPPTYEYERKWTSEPIDSSRFHETYGHENPAMPWRSREVTASEVSVGAFLLNDNLKQAMQDWQALDFSPDALLESLPAEQRRRAVFHDAELFVGQHTLPDPAHPRVGDVRVAFDVVQPAEVSIIAQQRGSALGAYETSNGEKIEKLSMGHLTAAEVMDQLVTENTVLAWVIRIGGVVLSVAGFGLCLRPLSALVSFIPGLGALTSAALFLVALLLGGIVSFTTIGLAWIAVRPLLGMSALALSALGIWLVFSLRTSKQDQPIVIT